ncbi:MAG: hypothetical protein HQL41_08920 [Alphaproteobacteria bacterium]|nr:hypothetical protein [Alphaproteobacteria bacterium]
MQPATQEQRHPWLDRLMADPAKAVDALLRGFAHLPGLQRASPCDALIALTRDLSDDAPERSALDRALLDWLRQRRADTDALVTLPGGVPNFVRETSEAMRAAWRLELPESSVWLRDNLLDLLTWAEDLSSGPIFDLGRAVLAAGAHLQQGRELRFLWFRIFDQAAAPRLRHRLDIAELGIARMDGGKAGGPPPELVVGLARWAARLPPNDGQKGEVVRQWRAVKGAFPRQPSFWRKQWQAIFDEGGYDHPFVGWLRDADPALKPAERSVRREPSLPKDIQGVIRDFKAALRRDRLTPARWLPMKGLLEQLERYAEVTGNSYYLVTSCTSVASAICDQAPGHALDLARRALVWAPSDGHSWSTRASALERLGRPDLAITASWEGLRRAPADSALSNQLALLLGARGRTREAEALLRKASRLDPADATSCNNLARVLGAEGRFGEGIDLLRGFAGRAGDQAVTYLLGCLLIAEGRRSEAEAVLGEYRRAWREDDRTTTLARLIAAGQAGVDEERAHLRDALRVEAGTKPLPWDAEKAETGLAAERAAIGRLEPVALVGEANLLFGLNAADEASRLVDGVLARDSSDVYAHLVKALADRDYRQSLEGRIGRFAGSLPLRLAALQPHAPDDQWREMARQFPDGQPLIDLVRIAWTGSEGDAEARLERWAEIEPRWDDSWDKFLKGQIGGHLRGEPTALPLAHLAHDALTQAVNRNLAA